MLGLDPRKRQWVRWLATSRGLPPDHVAFILDVDQADVEELVRYRSGAHHVTIEQEDTVRKLARRGETYASIARTTGMFPKTVWNILNRRRLPGPLAGPPRHTGKAIRAETATKVRRMTALGYDPGEVAAVLCIRRAEIVDFLERLEPVRRPRNGTGELTRPREPAAQRRIRRRPRKPSPEPKPADEWGWRDTAGDDDQVELASVETPAATAIAAELPRAEVLPATPATVETDPSSWESSRAWGAADPSKRGDAAKAEQARALRAAGMIVKDVAAALGVSVATVNRMTKGEAHGQGLRALTVEQAAEARALHAEGATKKELATRYGVDRGAIDRALRRGDSPRADDAQPSPIEVPCTPPAIVADQSGWDWGEEDGDDDLVALEAWSPPAIAAEPPEPDAVEVLEPATREPWEGVHYFNGVRPPKPMDIAEIERLYLAGASLAAIGERFGVSAMTVRARLIARGVARRPPGQRRREALSQSS